MSLKNFRMALLGLIAFAAVVGVLVRNNTIMSGYMGSVIGGAISGVLTLLGVIYTINWYREQDEKVHREQSERERTKRVNQLRVLLGELNYNRSIIELSDRHFVLMTRLQDTVWSKLQTELDWLDQATFKCLFDLYVTLMEARIIEWTGEDEQNLQKYAQGFIQAIDNIRDRIISVFPELNEALPLSGDSQRG